jgi:hypothetical protein
MSVVSTVKRSSDLASLLSDKINLSESVQILAGGYKNAKPFPHVVIDNLFSESLLDDLVQETPPIDDDFWVHHDNDHEEKYGLRSAVELGPIGFQLTAFLHSASFLYFLSELTGIWQILPDPYLQGAGYSLIPHGAKFDVHCDRNVAYETGLRRRLALIIYLNKDWRHEYGGQLELWSQDGTRCEAVVEPVFNRTIVFAVDEGCYHGVPSPINTPFRGSRKSFLLYFHTAETAGGTVVPHTSIWSPAFNAKRKAGFRGLVRDLTPPLLLRSFRKFRPPKVA